MGQNPFPSSGASEGQCPLRLRVQNIRSKGGNAKDNRWAKCKGSDTSKMKGTANHSCGESQASEATEVDEGGCQELILTQSIGGSGEKNTKWELSREERSFIKDTVDSQTEEKEKESRALDQVLNSRKNTNESLLSVDSGVGREEDDAYAREKMQCHNSVAKDLSGRRNNLGFKTQVGRKFIRSPKTSEEITLGIGLDAEGEGYTRVGRRVRPGGEGQGKEDGACPVSSSSVGQFQFQEEGQAGSSQVREAGRGTGSDLVLGSKVEWG